MKIPTPWSFPTCGPPCSARRSRSCASRLCACAGEGCRSWCWQPKRGVPPTACSRVRARACAAAALPGLTPPPLDRGSGIDLPKGVAQVVRGSVVLGSRLRCWCDSCVLDLLMPPLTLTCRHRTNRPHRPPLVCHGCGRRACRAASDHNSVCGLAAAGRPHAQVCAAGDCTECVAGSGCLRWRICRRCCRRVSAATGQQVHGAMAHADWDHRRGLLGNVACVPFHGRVGVGGGRAQQVTRYGSQK